MDTELETFALHEKPLIDVYDRLANSRDDWRALFETAACGPYQSYDFAAAWVETIGRSSELVPMIVVARDGRGAPLAVFPLATRKVGGLRVAVFLCGRESNSNIGLFRPNISLNARSILLRAAGQGAPRPDLYFLLNQPYQIEDQKNPLDGEDVGPSPSFAYGVALPQHLEALAAKLSKASRKKLRKKEQHLARLGELVAEHRASGARAREIVAALIAQKSSRLASKGVDGVFDDPAMRAFLERALDNDAIEIHALSLSGNIIATYIGLAHRGRFSALANSFELDEEIARCSPGDLLLHDLLRDLVSRGFAYFDLGIGEARYKEAVCDETIELFDLILPATWRGALAAPAFRTALAVKRLVKHSPRLTRLLVSARLFGGA